MTFVSAAFALAFISVSARQNASSGNTVAITDVSVIDGTGRATRPHMTLLIVNGRIARVAAAERLSVPETAQVIPGSGKFVIPGLWDMHVHLGRYEEARSRLRQLLRSGVTGVRDMASPLDDVIRLRQGGMDGSGTNRTVFVAGPILQGPLPFAVPPMVRPIADPDAARETIDELQRRGVDFIKVGDTLPLEVYRAIVAEAKRQHLTVAGHVPVSVGAWEAAAAGQRSIEHLGSATFHSVLIACSRRESALTAYVQDALARAMTRGEAPDARLTRADFASQLVADYDDSKASRLFARFVERGTWQVPTLTALQAVLDAKAHQLNADDLAAAQRIWQKQRAVVGAMARAQVPIMAGTDVPISDNLAPLHQELVLLVNAGLSPMQALQAATRNAAAFVGRSRDFGTIEPGRVADLVMLDADPLMDIRNTRRVFAVMLNGALIRGN